MQKLPDPKTLIDSVADGAIELGMGPARVARNVASVAETFATDVETNMNNVKTALPDDPSVLPDAAIKGAGQTVNAVIGMFKGVGKGVMDTLSAVESQIKRVTG